MCYLVLGDSATGGRDASATTSVPRLAQAWQSDRTAHVQHGQRRAAADACGRCGRSVPQVLAAHLCPRPGALAALLRVAALPPSVPGLAACAGRRLADEQAHRLPFKAGADPNVKSEFGNTPLHDAIEKGQAGTAEVLIKAGADLNAKDRDGRTPLHYASEKGQAGTAEGLIKAGADLNAKDNNGHTALWWAVNEDHTQTAALLREHGATK